MCSFVLQSRAFFRCLILLRRVCGRNFRRSSPIYSYILLLSSLNLGEKITLSCNVSEGDEANIQIKWYNSKESGVLHQSRVFNLPDKKLSDSERSFTAIYWCAATNSFGTSKNSENVTVNIVSKGKSLVYSFSSLFLFVTIPQRKLLVYDIPQKQ